MARPTKKRQRAGKDARRNARRFAKSDAALMEKFLEGLQTFAYVVCEACGQEQSSSALTELPCFMCGHGLARYHPDADALKATFRASFAV